MAIRKNTLAYIAVEKAKYSTERPAKNFKTHKAKVPFLWGDQVYVIDTNRRTSTISAKGHIIKIPTNDLMEEPIFCLWQIDCGQGDAALIRLPNGKIIMIDAGPGPLMSNSPAMAPGFLRWMRFVDQSWRDQFEFGEKAFNIDAVVISHPDYDHYAGFLDMFDDLDDGNFRFGNVYHNGLGRFSGEPKKLYRGKGMSQLGPVVGQGEPDLFLNTLIDGFEDVKKYSRKAGARKWILNGKYADLLQGLSGYQGNKVGKLYRVSERNDGLPNFDSGETDIVLLGPIEEEYKGKPALRFIDKSNKSGMRSPSLTRNGISVVMRFDYGGFRLLMTGDLNFRSQALLLDNVASTEFKCHVAKSCHHGSEDISTTFLQAMSPNATLFSSGDNETHAHPRAKILGMAGAFSRVKEKGSKKYLGLEEQHYESPLIYSTELSRSVTLYSPSTITKNGSAITDAELSSEGAGGRKGPTRPVNEWLLADNFVYGLINVRTDGNKVVIGVLKEGKNAGFQTEKFYV